MVGGGGDGGDNNINRAVFCKFNVMIYVNSWSQN